MRSVDRAEQALQAAPQIGGLADVRLGLRVFAAQEEDGRARREPRQRPRRPARA